jgi:hypothetical protein
MISSCQLAQFSLLRVSVVSQYLSLAWWLCVRFDAQL